MDWLDPLAVQGTLKSLLQHHSLKVSILQRSAIFIVQLSHPYMTTGKTIALTRQAFVGKAMSLFFCIHRFNQNWNFNLLLIESMNAKPADIVDKLYSLHYAILYMGLEHPQILVFAGSPRTNPPRILPILALLILLSLSWGRENLNNPSKVTEQGRSRVRTWTRLSLTSNQQLSHASTCQSIKPLRENERFTPFPKAQFLEPFMKRGWLACAGEESPRPF